MNSDLCANHVLTHPSSFVGLEIMNLGESKLTIEVVGSLVVISICCQAYLCYSLLSHIC